MVARRAEMGGRDWLYLVVNAARKAADYDHIKRTCPNEAQLEPLGRPRSARLAGAGSGQALARHLPDAKP